MEADLVQQEEKQSPPWKRTMPRLTLPLPCGATCRFQRLTCHFPRATRAPLESSPPAHFRAHSRVPGRFDRRERQSLPRLAASLPFAVFALRAKCFPWSWPFVLLSAGPLFYFAEIKGRNEDLNEMYLVYKCIEPLSVIKRVNASGQAIRAFRLLMSFVRLEQRLPEAFSR